LLLAQASDLRDHVFTTGNTRSLIHYISITVKDNQRRNASYSISLCSLGANLAHHAQTDHLRLTLQVTFYPIDDGLGHQARASSVAVEFDNHRLPIRKQAIQRIYGFEFRAPGTKKDKGADYAQEHDKYERIFAHKAKDLLVHL
jgi:hypothetical protein